MLIMKSVVKKFYLTNTLIKITNMTEQEINDLKRQKEGIENVLTNLALMPDEIKMYMGALAEINKELGYVTGR